MVFDFFFFTVDEHYVLPSCVVNGTAISKTFQILYRNEDVAINDLVMYRLHTLVDANKVGRINFYFKNRCLIPSYIGGYQYI